MALNPLGHSIIHTNSMKWHPECLEILLQNGLPADQPTSDERSMLSMCIGLVGYWPVVQLLVQYGANINQRYDNS